MRLFFLFMIINILISCKESGSHVTNDNVIKEFYGDGTLKSETIYINKTTKRKIIYTQNRAIEGIFHYKNDIMDGEQLWFHNNGFIEQKILYKNGKRNDKGYFFYPTGRLKQTRLFNNGIEVAFGADYWDDSLNLIKSSLHFNDSGQIYYKKNFDSNGHFLNEEGTKN